MAKISQYTDAGAPQPGDQLVINRAGKNYSMLGGSAQFTFQYKITPSASGGTLTVALKHLDGTDPSATKPLWFKIDNNWRAVIAALSVSVANGTNTFNAGSAELAAKEIDLFAYVSYRAASSAVVFGVSRTPAARLYSDFSATATNEKYAAFSTAPAATDSVQYIGRLAATLSAGAAYTWTVPTYTSANLIQYPIYSTRKLTFFSVLTGFSGTPTQTMQYQIVENRMQFYMIISGTSNLNTFTASLPFTATSASNDMQRLVDNGIAVNGLAVLTSALVVFYTSFAAGAWTAAGTKGCEAMTKTVFV